MKPKASLNKAKDTETPPPKLKCIDIPPAAKAEVNRMNQRLDIYLSGIAVGMGIKGNWRFDAQSMKFTVEDKK